MLRRGLVNHSWSLRVLRYICVAGGGQDQREAGTLMPIVACDVEDGGYAGECTQMFNGDVDCDDERVTN